ncbi:nucleotidyltransferase family protein [Mucilaginibacter sp. PAMB04274]|uniref:nucleotidyltransferase family protein n=1 Tax=Mucilaginibacter sp. PAMB04274 TaxID=3138568 RepID=UPI0031F68730
MTGIIILAAGSSSRMGQPKQQLVFQGQTLLQRAMTAAARLTDVKIVVVLGANNLSIIPDVDSKRADLVINPDWEQGMGSSIKAGLKALLELYPALNNVLLMLCDQPFVDTALLHQLIETGLTGDNSIVACTYQNTIGVPVWFAKTHFDELLALQEQKGAKKLLMKYQQEIVTIPFEKGAVDIDSPEDYDGLLGANSPL